MNSSRRKFLTLTVAAGSVTIAGCSGGNESNEETGGNGSDEETSGSGSDEETSSNDSNDSSSDSQTLGDVLSMPSSYVIDMVTESDEQTTRSTQYVNDGNIRIEYPEQPITTYIVDDTVYQVTAAGCRETSNARSGTADTEFTDDIRSKSVTGRETVDGQEAYVVSYTTERESASGESLSFDTTYYISVSTGRIIQVEQEGQDTTSEFTYRYEEVGPIELPDEC